ncbi:3-hydroxyacyl-CoA dehydrogenase/enoyl-CoA hydratase family protein [Pseudobacteriovorax antillogorgiicola]|uniref:3-hydroxyacyl-CoA dehydrogenase n=1 Tax=Pseudobacteriovorax antillogorgiicola TaxID=1513793 RepID=A0A1Y6B8R5_9BACT|nr:3-hydroxyacyl-CoA dehydrogenase/enoyl-CoA hydratase family protein [Pseudobacteriovorax antillogorgiicola]TCS58607.1 3-hydroxyacyl-CoA dehydrogenase [Pseudobacteriovorax antillogorgiicola]SME96919.1 3-hydroxyacyl-CoA dehydrogenase [Pseudobacteriovorax antillogorgiicola]
MALKIKKAAVLGAGVMGAQIAAHLAAAGVQTHLLDLSSDKAPEDKKLAKAVGKNFRSTPAILAIENLKKLKPAPLVSPSVLPNIIPGNFDDDMSVLADCDWVIEAVIERIDIKKSMLKKIAEYARTDVPITSNTSGLSMAKMCEDMDDSFQARFFGTHFFNPPRYMKLLEIVPHAKNNMEMVDELSAWIKERLGKGIVYTNDTINFIANRIGVFNMQSSLKHMEDLGLNVETVDALTGKLMGRPPSATLRTMDVVGIDTFAHVARNVYDYAPEDPYRDWFLPPKWISELIEKGHLGQKSGSKGAYMKTKDGGKTKILAYRPESGDYVEQAPTLSPWMAEAKKMPDTIERLKFVLKQDDNNAQFLWRILRDSMAYSAILLEEIANNQPLAVDNSIKWGFNWEWGPFQLWQALGHDEILDRMESDGVKLPDWVKKGIEFYKPMPNSTEWHMEGPQSQFMGKQGSHGEIPKEEHLYYLPRFQNPKDKRVVLSSKNASLVDIGDGVACLTFHSKMNALNSDICEQTIKAVEKVQADFDGLVIGNDGEVFSAGADLREVIGACKEKKFEELDGFLRRFQGAVQMIKYAPFPSVSCPQGLVLGGGCEVSLHASRQLVANDTFAGLVEVGVGLIPGGGGTKELALRAYKQMDLTEMGDPMPFLQRAFMLIGMARTSTSGQEAIEMGLYPQTAEVIISRDHQIDRAKKMVLEMFGRGYMPPIPAQGIKVVGDPGIQTFKMMLYNMVQGRQISEYDAFIGEKVATVLCGGEIDGGQRVNEQYFLDLERRVFLELCTEQKTQDRIEHMLKTGKPLRN